MKILQINSVYQIGSTGRIASEIGKLLINHQHQSKIAYGRHVSKTTEENIIIGHKLDTFIHVGLTRIFDRHGFGSLLATRSLLKKISNYHPDIIHLHNIHGYYLHIGMLFKYLKKNHIPVIWTLHDCWSFTGHCSHFDFIGCEKWKTGCYQCPEKNSYPKSMIIDNSKRNYREKRNLFTNLTNLRIITPSDWLAEKVKNSFLKDYPLTVIHNGIDQTVFKPTQSDFRSVHHLENKFLILAVAGTWSIRKGYRHFLELAKLIPNDMVIIMVGLNESQIGSLPDNIKGIVKTSNVTELAGLYSTSDVYVNFTLEDVLPTTNLEAQACGTPVITFKSGGSTECISENTGIAIEQGDINSAVELLNKLKNHEISFDESNLIRYISTFFNSPTQFGKYLSLYEEIYSQKS